MLARMRFALFTLLAIATSAVVVTIPATAQKDAETQYFALVIGYTEYRVRQKDWLKNSGSDLRLMAKTFRSLNVDTSTLFNFTGQYYKKFIQQFADRVAAAKGPKVIVVYVAAHGIEIGGNNYIVPPDYSAAWQTEDDARREGLAVSELIKKLTSVRANDAVFFFDMCRDNPFGDEPTIAKAGLATMSPTIHQGKKSASGAKTNVIISFATQPGDVTSDGEEETDRNSPYAIALAELLQQGNLPIKSVLEELKTRVSRATGGVQIPWYDGEHLDRIILGRRR